MRSNKFRDVLMLLAVSGVLRFFVKNFISDGYDVGVRATAITIILGVGALYVIRKVADIIEETTEVLSERTQLAGGFLQSFGTAFPDMVLGVVAAWISLGLKTSNYALSVNYAIIAAATTFGSNIYNILHAAWCIFRQNLANKLSKSVLMVPLFPVGGSLKPMQEHTVKPSIREIDTAINLSTALTILTAIVAVAMVLFGRVSDVPSAITGDLYQLIRPVGFAIFIITCVTLFKFRSSERQIVHVPNIEEEGNYYRKESTTFIWVNLLLAGGAILFTAESMVNAIEVLSSITGIPFVVAGIIAGAIGCLGEMVVVHNFSVNPNGRIGDAIVGVAMDNVVTILGASLVSILGAIFLGGNALILIFVAILTANTILIWQISQLKNYLV